MPELPEVESVVRGLRQDLPFSVDRVQKNRPDLRYELPDFLDTVGDQIVKVERRAKFILFYFLSGKVWLGHLGMTGQWLRAPNPQDGESGTDSAKHTHIELFGRKLLESETPMVSWRYSDPRRFGFLLEYKNLGLALRSSHLKDLGIEPLDDEMDTQLKTILQVQKGKHPQQSIKLWLMNQKNIVGIGNIYASEILFRSRINPNRAFAKISARDWAAIAKTTRLILSQAIASGGSSIRDYRNAEGNKGMMQTLFRVYDREGLPCLKCKTKILQVKMAGRSTFYCPRCQTY